MSAALRYLPHYTYDDYKNWEGRWELIAGIPYAMSPLPTLRHQDINVNILTELKRGLKKCGKCKVYMPIDWRMENDTIVQPDVSIVCGIAEGKYLTRTPSVVFEILSPSTSQKDRFIKFDLYQSKQVPYYVIVDPETNSAEIFIFNKGGYAKAIPINTQKFKFEFNGCKVTLDFKKVWE